MKSKIYRRTYRIRKAYGTAFRVLLSYLWLGFKAKLLGQKYYQNQIFEVHLRNAERIKKVILELQGLFIKVGQLLSILTNFLPPAFQEPLEALQDQIPARDFSEIEQRIIDELGAKPNDLFATFDKTPIAAASIGQVHRATLKDGREIVVKVQHQNIEDIAEVDLNIMQRLTRLSAYFFDIKGMEYAYTQVRKMIEEELDFKKEANSMQQIAANLSAEPKVKIPTIIPEFSTLRVLTSEYCEGVKISNLAQLEAWGIDKTELANRLVHAYCQMVFEDGFYHADPHPGNIIVQSDGTLVFLDFGAVARLQPNMRTGLLALIDGAVKNDDAKIIQALHSMGFIAKGRDAEKAAQKIVDALRQFLQNEVQIEGLNFQDIKVNPFETSLFGLIKELGFTGIANTVQVPKDYVLLNRMITLLLGICNTLDSQMNPIDIVQPYLQKYILGEKGNIVQFVTNLVKGNVTTLLALPSEVQQTLKKIQKGEVEWNVDIATNRNRLLYTLGQQFILTLLLIAAATFTYHFYLQKDRDLIPYGVALSGILFLILLRSMWRNRW